MNVRCLMAIMIVTLFALAGCEGDTGPAGPTGSAGTSGTEGPEGPTGPTGSTGPSGDEEPQGYTDADGIVGGASYAKWWTTEGGGGGTQPTTTVAADFYRCKACHAWDGLGKAGSYADRTGQSTLRSTRPDVSSINLRSTASSESFQEMFDLIAHAGARAIDAADNTHPDFSELLTDAQIWNLIKFMREEWVVPNLLYDLEVAGPEMYVDYSLVPPAVVAPTLTYTNIGSLGTEAAGQTLVTDRCAVCHGADGTTIDIGGRSLGQFVREKPHEAWFKAKFGEPGTGMTPGLVTATADLQNLYRALANSTNFPDLP